MKLETGIQKIFRQNTKSDVPRQSLSHSLLLFPSFSFCPSNGNFNTLGRYWFFERMYYVVRQAASVAWQISDTKHIEAVILFDRKKTWKVHKCKEFSLLNSGHFFCFADEKMCCRIPCRFSRGNSERSMHSKCFLFYFIIHNRVFGPIILVG